MLYSHTGKIGAGLTVLGVGLLLQGCNRASPPPNLEKMRGLAAVKADEPWDSKFEKLAEQAVIDAWKHYQVALDFSTNSIKSEELILDRLSQSSRFQAFSEKDKRAEAIIAGAYVGEVIRRNHGGTWGTNSEVAGENSLPMKFGSKEAFPITWCLKRLINGREDNVWHKYVYLVVGRTNDIPVTATFYSNRDEWLKTEGITTNAPK